MRRCAGSVSRPDCRCLRVGEGTTRQRRNQCSSRWSLVGYCAVGVRPPPRAHGATLPPLPAARRGRGDWAVVLQRGRIPLSPLHTTGQAAPRRRHSHSTHGKLQLASTAARLQLALAARLQLSAAARLGCGSVAARLGSPFNHPHTHTHTHARPLGREARTPRSRETTRRTLLH